MFKQVSATLNTYSSCLAYIYCGIDHLATRTFSELLEETQQITHLFTEMPKGSLVAVNVGKHPCLLPIIYCLLEHEIAFILLDANNSHGNLKGNNIKLYAVVTCNVHTERIDDNSSNTCCQVTKLGCSYQLNVLKSQTIEEYDDALFKYHGICYVITTSGTVGVKKLVKVTETSIFSNIKSFIKLFDITNEDVVYFGTPLSFDPCFIEIFLSLTTGACLFTTSKQIRNNPHKLVKTLFPEENITSKRVTFMQMCPSVFLQFSQENIDFILYKSGLKTLTLGGEQFPACIVSERTPKTCKVYNLYGITEVSCWASVERVFHGQDIALGLPLDETEFQIETLQGKVLNYSAMNSNEIYEGLLKIGSKTRLCFIDNEKSCRSIDVNTENLLFRSTGDLVKVQNGRIFYVGRQNDVIKRLGHRVSMAKLQALVYNLTQLVNQSVIYENKVFCFLQINMINMVNVKSLNEFKRKTVDKINVKLMKSLPSEYMPDYVDIISKFPVRASNGKVDLLCLQEIAHKLLEESTITGVNSINSGVFVELWFKYLGISRSDCHLENLNLNVLNFWDSGGNSIRALQFVQEYETKTRCLFNRALLDLKLEEAINFIDRNSFTYDKDQLRLQKDQSGEIKMIWKAGMAACIDSPPTVCRINETGYLAVGDFAHTFSVFEETTGTLVATTELPNVIGAACLVLRDMFYVPCFDGVLYCLKLSPSSTRAKLQCLWSYKTNDQLKSKPCWINNTVVFGSYDGNVYSLTERGCLVWKTSVGEPIGTAVKHSGDKIFVGTLKGNILCILHDTREIKWRYKARSPIFCSPEVSEEYDCVLFLDIQGNIYAFTLEEPTCSLLWMFVAASSPLPMKTFGSMTLMRNRIVLGTLNGKVIVLRFNHVKCNYEDSMALSCTSSVTTKPLVLCESVENAQNSEKYLVVVNSVGCVHFIRINEGNNGEGDDRCGLELVSNYSLPNECFSSPQLNLTGASRIYLGCRDNNLYCLEIVQHKQD